jgi:hypothetical protein
MITLTYNISEADAVIALQSKLKKNSQIQAAVKSQDIPVFFVKVCTCLCHIEHIVIILSGRVILDRSLFFIDKHSGANNQGTSRPC